MLEEFLRANLARWDELADVHARSAFYDVEGFRRGRDTLLTIESEELGPFVHEGTTLLHLQCHLGLDTLSWARRGAVVTGVDFSERALQVARRLAQEAGLAHRSRFIRSDVLQLDDALQGEFDVVFASWGVLNWIGDLRRWAAVAAHFVRPGGRLYLAEFHPVVFLIDDHDENPRLRLGWPYFQGHEPTRFDEPGSYADHEAPTRHTVSYEWSHTLGDIVTAVIRAGLRVDFLHEFPYIRGLAFPFLEEADDGWLHVRGRPDDLPLSLSLMATRGV